MKGLAASVLEWVRGLPDAAALTGTLLHSLWEGAVVALALSIVLIFVRSSRLRYAASCIAMLALVVGLVVTFIQLVPVQPVSVRYSGLVRTSSAGSVVRANRIAIPKGATSGIDPTIWIALLWMGGVFVFYLRAIAAWISAVKIRKTGVCAATELWRERIGNLRERLQVSRPVALLESSLAEVPVVIGYLRPVILMPVGLMAGLPTAQVEAILLHELAHIRRHDYLVNLMQVLVEGLLFYHPAVWWISSVIRVERENCCDEVVVSITGAPHDFAQALTALEQRRVLPREALAATGSRLVNRIARLLGRPQPRYAGALPLMAMVVLTLAAISATAGLQPERRVQIPVVLKASVVPAPVKPAPVMIAQAQPAPAQPQMAPPKPESAPPAPAIEPPAPPLYKLGPRDVVQILVFDEPHVTGTYTISAEGDLVFPLINKIHAEGLTIPDLQKELVHQLIEVGGISQPTVNVQLLRSNTSVWIQVIGNVATPVQFKITTPISLYEALAKAGWTTPDAGPNVVVKKPGSDVPEQINLDDLQKRDKDPKINLILNGGEIITVPGRPKVSVTGQVAHPGSVPIERPADATVLKVIAKAGGLTQYYGKTAYIWRLADNGPRQKIAVPLRDIMHRKAPDVPLQAGDTLWIPPLGPRSVPPEYYDTRPRLIPITAEKRL